MTETITYEIQIQCMGEDGNLEWVSMFTPDSTDKTKSKEWYELRLKNSPNSNFRLVEIRTKILLTSK